MTRNDKIRCLAMAIGDGYIREDCSQLRLAHSPKQKEYMLWKIQMLEKATGQKMYIKEVVHHHVEQGVCYPGLQSGVSHRFFRVLRNRLYKDGVKTFSSKWLKILTPEAIAIWYMDDGSLYPKKRNGKIHAYELVLSLYVSEEQAEIVRDYFYSVHKIAFTIKRNKGLCSIRCGTHEARKFIALVKPFVIDSLQYKVDL